MSNLMADAWHEQPLTPPAHIDGLGAAADADGKGVVEVAICDQAAGVDPSLVGQAVVLAIVAKILNRLAGT